jgi:hypothetical protein
MYTSVLLCSKPSITRVSIGPPPLPHVLPCPKHLLVIKCLMLLHPLCAPAPSPVSACHGASWCGKQHGVQPGLGLAPRQGSKPTLPWYVRLGSCCRWCARVSDVSLWHCMLLCHAFHRMRGCQYIQVAASSSKASMRTAWVAPPGWRLVVTVPYTYNRPSGVVQLSLACAPWLTSDAGCITSAHPAIWGLRY